MLVCDLPCDECHDTTMPKFCGLAFQEYVDGKVTLKLEIHCPEHSAGHSDTQLLREGAD